jgi:hypothetical protein
MSYIVTDRTCNKAIDTAYICGCPLKCIRRRTAVQDVVEVCARNSKHTAEKRLVYVSKAQANIFVNSLEAQFGGKSRNRLLVKFARFGRIN